MALKSGRAAAKGSVRRKFSGESPLDAKFDLPAAAEPHLKYFFAFVPRSGSTFCSTQLWKTGLLGAPMEYLNYYYDMIQLVRRLQVNSLDEYLSEIVKRRTTPNGVFGLKVSRVQFEFLTSIEFAHKLKPQRWIFMDRKDKCAQAVSLSIAIQTRAWSSRNKPVGEPKYDFEHIRRRYNRLVGERRYWNAFFESKRIEPVCIDYEDFAADSGGFVRRLLDDWNVPSEPAFAPIVPGIDRQRSSINDEWIARFREEIEATPDGQR